MMLGGPDVIVSEFFRQHGFLKMLVVDLGYRAMPLRRVSKGQKNSKIHRRSLLARDVVSSCLAAFALMPQAGARWVMQALLTSSPVSWGRNEGGRSAGCLSLRRFL